MILKSSPEAKRINDEWWAAARKPIEPDPEVEKLMRDQARSRERSYSLLESAYGRIFGGDGGGAGGGAKPPPTTGNGGFYGSMGALEQASMRLADAALGREMLLEEQKKMGGSRYSGGGGGGISFKSTDYQDSRSGASKQVKNPNYKITGNSLYFKTPWGYSMAAAPPSPRLINV
jgi:hypothetical protein